MQRQLPLAALLAALILTLKLGFPMAPQATLVATDLDPWGVLRNQLACWSRLFTTAHWLPHPLYQVLPWEGPLGRCFWRLALPYSGVTTFR